MQAIKTLDTKNYTYYIGYGRAAKTSFEQQQELHARFIRLAIQKIVALIIIVLCTGISLYTKEGMCMIIGLLLGSLMLFCNNLFS
jgi:hypothetical protein